MATYKWKPYAHVKIDAQAAGEVLEAARIRNNGQLTPRAVVEEAKPDDSPLHDHFEWRDDVAAQKYREDQAAYLIRMIAMEVEEAKEPVRAFVNVRMGDSQAYTSTVVAMADPDLRAQVLAQAMRELVSWRQRYSELEQLAEVFALVDQKVSAQKAE